MGLQDREYYQDRRPEFQAGSVVFVLVMVNVFIWLFQVAFIRSSFQLEEFLACNPGDLFERLYLWQPITASFLHDPRRIDHVLVNMLFLYFFGRELEGIYGRRDFLIFYLVAGSLSILAEAAFHYFGTGMIGTRIMGASGAVMGVVVLFTTFFPRREIYLALFIPIEAWLLCVLFVIWDLYGFLRGGPSSGAAPGVAFVAHLAGAAMGFLYRYLDLRSEPLRARLGRLLGLLTGRGRGPRRARRPSRTRPVRRPAASTRPPAGESLPPPGEPARDPVSERIDQLLEKISRKESLTPEEREFLQKNSGRYRSDG